MPALAPMERHGGHRVEPFVDRDRSIQHLAQRSCERLHPRVLEEVNQIAEGTLIKTEARSAIEPAKARPADRADTLGIQWIGVNERCIAARTEVFRLKLPRGVETIRANRNAGPFVQDVFTDAAFVGEKQRENAAGDRSEC